MEKIVIEYIWLDNDFDIRSKIRILSIPSISPDKNIIETFLTDVSTIPEWSFDGTATQQSYINTSDLILKPVKVCLNPFIKGLLVLCDVYMYYNNEIIPHSRNTRLRLVNYQTTDDILISVKQYYYILVSNDKKPEIYKKMYCSSKNNKTRSFAEEHLKLCLQAGLTITSLNAESGPNQWRFTIGPTTVINVCDELWLARFLLYKLAEKNNINISLEPKPLGVDYPGSACHLTISTEKTRNENGYNEIVNILEKLSIQHTKFVEVCGTNTEKRLIGQNDVSLFNRFSTGLSTRNTSIRIPSSTMLNKKGYYEERRPSANVEPYQLMLELLQEI